MSTQISRQTNFAEKCGTPTPPHTAMATPLYVALLGGGGHLICYEALRRNRRVGGFIYHSFVAIESFRSAILCNERAPFPLEQALPLANRFTRAIMQTHACFFHQNACSLEMVHLAAGELYIYLFLLDSLYPIYLYCI